MTKNHESVIRDIFNVMSSNIISLISSIVTGLFVPKLLGATSYGYYRMFVLYTTYTAFLHFGFVDGILLKDGNKDYDELSKYKYRSNSIIFIISQFIIGLLFVIISLFVHKKIVSTLLLTIGIGTFFINVTTYYRFISQIIMRFKELSIRNTIQSALIIIFTFFLWLFYKFNIVSQFSYNIYIWIILFIYFIMFLIYIVSYRDITIGNHDSLKYGLFRVINYCKIGIYLTISYQISNLILIIDNQFVSIFFKTSTYGKYSFSYSMTNTALTILSAVATVLLPHLKRDSVNHIMKIYPKMISSMMLAIYFFLLAYFPLCILIKIILPEYVISLSYLRIFLPEVGITCCVTMVIFNYYNVLNKSKFYFYMSMIVLFISFILDSGIYIMFHDPIWLALGSFISLSIWYILSEYFLIRWYNVKWQKNFIYMIMMVGSFFIASLISNLIVGFLVYLFIYLIASWILFHQLIIQYMKLFLSRL